MRLSLAWIACPQLTASLLIWLWLWLILLDQTPVAHSLTVEGLGRLGNSFSDLALALSQSLKEAGVDDAS